jgi:3-hydroxyisobutyrate dehydrogenase
VREIGFIGLGVMGAPMAKNLVRTGCSLTVWNRSAPAREALASEGSRIAASPAEVFATADVVLLMVANGDAVNEVMGRTARGFDVPVSGRLVVPMGTTPPEYSLALGQAVRAAGGSYAEAPVSGSRKPAEDAQLVAMIAGDELDLVEETIAPMCARVIRCGDVPSALATKLAVNLYLITTVTGLAEATHFAAAQGIDMEIFRTVLDAGPMSSAVSRMKLEKLVGREFSVQASIADVLYNNRVVAAAARRKRIATPLLDASHALFDEAQRLGYGREDMAAIVRAIEARTEQIAQ